MDPVRTEVNLHRLDPDTPFYGNMSEYLSITISCLSSYRVQHDIQQELRNCSDKLTGCQGDVLMELVNNGDPNAILDTAIRYLSGCMTRMKSVEGALYVLDAFLDPSCNDGRYVGDVASRTLMAQAHACAAHAHYAKFTASSSERLAIQADERRFSRPETMRIGVGQPPLSSLALAAHHANESVKRGLVSPIVLVVGFKMRDLGEALGVNLDQMSRAKKFRPLWRVISRRIDELYAEERRRQSRAYARPNQYVCAAVGCGIRGEQRGALKACGGRCPSDIKPSYCSKECQKRDWPKHKEICKPGSSGKAPEVADRTKALELFGLGECEDGDVEEELQDDSETPRAQTPSELLAEAVDQQPEVRHGRRRVIDIPAPNLPGGSIQVTSNTMDPEFMRSFRDATARLIDDGS